MQLLKQEQNSAKLKVYFSAMDLYFHKQEEDFNASMSLLSIFHEELHENFQFYEAVFDRFYHKDVNAIIPMQAFFNFAKLMNLASSADELMGFFNGSLREIDGIYVPIDDTLNVKGGMNYAQFLSALLRIAYIKADASGDQSPQAYKNALDAMFNPNMRTDAQGRQTEDPSLASRIDIKKRQTEDPILAYVYEPDNLKIFYQS